MRKTLSLFITILSFHSLLAQSEVKRLPKHKLTQDYTVFMNGALSSCKMLQKINPKDIKNLEIITYKFTDPHHVYISDLAKNGLLKVKLKNTFKTISQSQLNKKFDLPENNEVYFDGYLIYNKDDKICKDAIVEIELVNPNAVNLLSHSVINIHTMDKQERHLPVIKGCSMRKVK
ncbi:hypothetical protein BKI52_16330 [marine bacterium AO1-C]|nr:hypothetical protein BKI52_16330 [marine bacterium AO1-C]